MDLMRKPMLLVALLTAAACDSAPTAFGPADHDLSFAKGRAGNDPSAVGHAQIAVGNLAQSYSFTAQRVGKDNRFQGEWELSQVASGTGSKLHGDVVCFNAYGNLAFIIGVIDRSDDPAYSVGDGVAWQVQDNGEGAKANPDLANPMVVTPGGPNFGLCSFGPLPSNPITNGNIQVRGSDLIPA
jgi:hypothetical protein